MKATEHIALTLTTGLNWLKALTADLHGRDLLVGSAGGDSHHTLWLIGHLAVCEAGMLDEMIHGRSNPLTELKAVCDYGTQAQHDGGMYPTKDELIDMLTAQRRRTLDYLAGLDDSALDGPSRAPDQLKAHFGTIGQCFAMHMNHQAFHCGQIADVRRALGRKPLFG